MNAAAGIALLSGPYPEHLVGFAALVALVALLAALVVASLRPPQALRLGDRSILKPLVQPRVWPGAMNRGPYAWIERFPDLVTHPHLMPDLHEDVRAHREWLLSFVDVPEGGAVADLGCGDGDDLLALAARHPHPATRFTGVDASEARVAAAAARAAGDPRVAFHHHRLGGRLPFADGAFDAVYSHNLLEYLPDPGAFAREVARILRPGGVAVVAHWDWDSQLYDGADKDVVRRLVHAFADWKQADADHADGWMGRRLRGTFAPTGLFDGAVHARVLMNATYAAPWYGHARARDFGGLVRRGLASADDYRRFIAGLEALEREGRYFYTLTGYVYVGRRR